jgi:hypothetical protein
MELLLKPAALTSGKVQGGSSRTARRDGEARRAVALDAQDITAGPLIPDQPQRQEPLADCHE